MVQKIFSEIQPDLVCELLTSMTHATAHFFGSPPPGALGRGQKVKYLGGTVGGGGRGPKLFSPNSTRFGV